MPPKHLRTLKFTQINLEEACALWQAFGKNHILSYSCHLPLPWLLEKDGKRVCLLMLASLSNFESANTKKSPYLITRLKTLPLLNDISTSTGFTITTIIHWSHPIWGSLRCLQFIPFQLAVWAIVLKFSHDLGQLGISQPTVFFFATSSQWSLDWLDWFYSLVLHPTWIHVKKIVYSKFLEFGPEPSEQTNKKSLIFRDVQIT